MRELTNLAIILPCFNEEETLNLSYGKLKKYLNKLIQREIISTESTLCFVNDGSTDSTWDIILEFTKKDPNVSGLKLSRNFGQQNAILAAFQTLQNSYDCYITMDVDLQDDLETIEKMLSEYKKGSSIVYGVRDDRSTDSFFKRTTAVLFYKFMNSLGVETVYNHSEYRLLDNVSLKELMQFKEVNFFLRGIVPLLGFNTSKVYYQRFKREAGVTKYSVGKLMAHAWNGISSFSIKPMRFVLIIGFLTFILSLVISFWMIYIYYIGKSIPGWFSTLFPLLLLSGLQMMSIGVLGEYIGKIFLETKERPRFIVETFIPKSKK